MTAENSPLLGSPNLPEISFEGDPKAPKSLGAGTAAQGCKNPGEREGEFPSKLGRKRIDGSELMDPN